MTTIVTGRFDRSKRRQWARPVLLLAGIHVAAIGSPLVPVAYAQDPSPATPVADVGPDTITLKTGGFLKGTLIEVIPGSHARMQVKGGMIATVRWKDIDHIERTSRPAAAAPPPVAEASGPVVIVGATPPAATPNLGAATVHIESDSVVELQASNDGEWKTVCISPCDRAIALGGTYRVVGEGMKSSGPFRLHAGPGQHLDLEVTPRSGGLFALGIVGTVVGGLALAVGLLVIMVGALENTSFGLTGGATNSGGSGTEAAGLGIVGVGVLGVVGGIVLIATNTKTRVSQDTGGGGGDSARLIDARLPVWREVGATHSTPGGARPFMGVPILSGTF